MAVTEEKFEMLVTISQPELKIAFGSGSTPSQKQLITFGSYFKGEKGEKGDDGETGKSAYEIWLDEGHTGTEEDFLEWLKAAVKSGTTSYWNSQIGYVPTVNEIIIYTDKDSKVVNNETIYIPGIKIGSGNGYVQDLAFVADDIADDLLAHINNINMHVTTQEKMTWNNKLNVDDNQEVVEETLIFNRN